MIQAFTIPGYPRGKSRPRFVRMGKYVRTYQPKEDEEREKAIKAAYLKAFGNIGPYSGPVAISMEVVYTVPPSRPKREKLSPGPKVTKPDLDNVVKSVLDGLNKVAYTDDAHVIRQDAWKRFGERDEIIVTIERIGGTADLFACVSGENNEQTG